MRCWKWKIMELKSDRTNKIKRFKWSTLGRMYSISIKFWMFFALRKSHIFLGVWISCVGSRLTSNPKGNVGGRWTAYLTNIIWSLFEGNDKYVKNSMHIYVHLWEASYESFHNMMRNYMSEYKYSQSSFLKIASLKKWKE